MKIEALMYEEANCEAILRLFRKADGQGATGPSCNVKVTCQHEFGILASKLKKFIEENIPGVSAQSYTFSIIGLVKGDRILKTNSTTSNKSKQVDGELKALLEKKNAVSKPDAHLAVPARVPTPTVQVVKNVDWI